MTPKEKAGDLVEKYKNYVHGYVGSSMLTNYEYPEQILSQAKKVAVITVDEVLHNLSGDNLKAYLTVKQCAQVSEFWEQVKQEIEKL